MKKIETELLEKNIKHDAEKKSLRTQILALEFALEYAKQNTSQYSNQYLLDVIQETSVEIFLVKAELAMKRRDWIAMENHGESALKIAKELNSVTLIAHCDFYRGIALFGQKKWETAYEVYKQSSPCIGVYSIPQAEEWHERMEQIRQAVLMSPIDSAYPPSAMPGSWKGKSPTSAYGWENLGNIPFINSVPETPDSAFETSDLNTPMPTLMSFPWQASEQLSRLSESSSAPSHSWLETFQKAFGWLTEATQEGKPVLKIVPPFAPQHTFSGQYTKPIPDVLEPSKTHLKSAAQSARSRDRSGSDPYRKEPSVLSEELACLEIFEEEEDEDEDAEYPLKEYSEDTPWESDSNPTTLLGSLENSWGDSSNSTNLTKVNDARSNLDLASNSGSTVSTEKQDGYDHTRQDSDLSPRADSDSTNAPSYLREKFGRLCKHFDFSSIDSAPEPSTPVSSTFLHTSPEKSLDSPQDPPTPAENEQNPIPMSSAISGRSSAVEPATNAERGETKEHVHPTPSRSFSATLQKIRFGPEPLATKEPQDSRSANRRPLTADALLRLGQELRAADRLASAKFRRRNRLAKSVAVPSVDSEPEARDPVRKAVSEYGGWKIDSGLRVRRAASSSVDLDDGVWDVTHVLWNPECGEDEDEEEEEGGEKPRGLLWGTVGAAWAIVAVPFRNREVSTEEDW